MEALIREILKGRLNEVNQLVKAMLEEGIAAESILDEALLVAMDEVGKKWKAGEYFIPEVLIAARCFNSALEILEPELLKSNIEPKGLVVIGTVKGDLHDIGKNLVALMLKSKGFKIIDLGTDVDPESFVTAVKNEGAGIVCMSSLLTTAMPNFVNTIQALSEAGLREKVCVAIGGAPVTQAFADSIGADLYAGDAVSCAEALLRRV